MLLSQRIALMLEQMLEEGGGELSIVRNELADRIGCVPSQINYVITSRFTPERGYLVESRRGGGGFIRIRKIPMTEGETLMHFYQAISSSIDPESARVFLKELIAQGVIEKKEARLIGAMLSDTALSIISREGRDRVRAQLFKTAILQLLMEREESI